MTFPVSLPGTVGPFGTVTVSAAGHGTALHITDRANIIGLGSKVGLGTANATPTGTVALVGVGAGTSGWHQVSNHHISGTASISRSKLATPRVAVWHNANQEIAHNTLTPVAFNQEIVDTDGFHDTVTDNSHLTVPYTGTYFYGGLVEWEEDNLLGQRIIAIRLNSSIYLKWFPINADVADAADYIAHQAWGVHDFVAGDYIEMIVYQDSGSAVTLFDGTFTYPQFQMVQLG